MGIQETDGARPAIADFGQRRAVLNQRIDDAGREIDAWFERHARSRRLEDLADLGALLKTRRDLLEELAALDDQFVSWILQQRG